MEAVKERKRGCAYPHGRYKSLEKKPHARKRGVPWRDELSFGHGLSGIKGAVCSLCQRRAHSRRAPFVRIERKFNRLRDEWKTQRQHESSTARMVMLPAYQKIIGMGPDVVPLLLRELETDLDAWFWALRAITEADPVREEDRGNGEAMARAWLQWGKEQGIDW